MSSYSETVLQELVSLAQKNRCGLFEAASDYCEEHDIDQAEFISSLDKHAIEQLRVSAVQERKVRRCVQPPVASLV